MEADHARETILPHQTGHRTFVSYVHAYCLMPHYYHLVVRTPGADLSPARRQVDGFTTQRHNRSQAVGIDSHTAPVHK